MAGPDCPCGLAKKYKHCHGQQGLPDSPLHDDPQVDRELLALAYNILGFLKDAIESVTMPAMTDANLEEVSRKRTLLYFAKKVYRATLAGMTLIRVGQATKAFTLSVISTTHGWLFSITSRALRIQCSSWRPIQ